MTNSDIPDDRCKENRSSTRVVMFHIGRSGSTVLGDLLNQHRSICWDGEIYRELFAKFGGQMKDMRISDDPYLFLSSRIARSKKPCYGFEVKFFHLRIIKRQLQDYMKDLDSAGVDRFIVLRRRNYLRKIVSSIVMRATGVTHIPSNKTADLVKVRVEVDRIALDREVKPLMYFLESYEENFSLLNELLSDKTCLSITYEMIFNPTRCWHTTRPLPFLESNPKTRRSGYQERLRSNWQRSFRIMRKSNAHFVEPGMNGCCMSNSTCPRRGDRKAVRSGSSSAR